jgi:hypothetical protein
MPSRFRLAAAAAVLFVATGPAPAARQEPAGRITRTVYVSAVDKDNRPITDMQAADFEVKEDGKVQEIAVKPATKTLRIAMLVADWGTGSFQAGMHQFMQKMLGHAEIALYRLLPQPIKIMDYAYDPISLGNGLSKFGAQGRQQGAQLLEAIQEVSRTVATPSTRPVIVVLRIGSESLSTIPGDTVREAVRKSGAILEVVNLGVRTSAMQSATGADGMTATQNRLRDMEARDSAFALAQVLGDGSRETGGRNDQVISTTLVTVMDSLAEELLNQYEITYTLPAGMKPNEKISVGSKRRNVTVRAPNRLPALD